MNARKGNITVEPYTRSVRTVQWEGREIYSPSTLFVWGMILERSCYRGICGVDN